MKTKEYGRQVEEVVEKFKVKLGYETTPQVMTKYRVMLNLSTWQLQTPKTSLT